VFCVVSISFELKEFIAHDSYLRFRWQVSATNEMESKHMYKIFENWNANKISFSYVLFVP
jgi:hypothetical protein